MYSDAARGLCVRFVAFVGERLAGLDFLLDACPCFLRSFSRLDARLCLSSAFAQFLRLVASSRLSERFLIFELHVAAQKSKRINTATTAKITPNSRISVGTRASSAVSFVEFDCMGGGSFFFEI